MNIVCRSNLSHNCIKNSAVYSCKYCLKLIFEFLYSFLAKFCLWLSGGTSQIVQFFSISALNSADTLLTRMCVVGLMTLVAIRFVHNAR
jgi:hypothetical protein